MEHLTLIPHRWMPNVPAFFPSFGMGNARIAPDFLRREEETVNVTVKSLVKSNTTRVSAVYFLQCATPRTRKPEDKRFTGAQGTKNKQKTHDIDDGNSTHRTMRKYGGRARDKDAAAAACASVGYGFITRPFGKVRMKGLMSKLEFIQRSRDGNHNSLSEVTQREDE
jgi:hypothetical protein